MLAGKQVRYTEECENYDTEAQDRKVPSPTATPTARHSHTQISGVHEPCTRCPRFPLDPSSNRPHVRLAQYARAAIIPVSSGKAAEYFKKSLDSDPKNIAVRADYATSLYYMGDVDGALAQLNKSLTYDRKHAGTLFNIGMIEWKGKADEVL